MSWNGPWECICWVQRLHVLLKCFYFLSSYSHCSEWQWILKLLLYNLFCLQFCSFFLHKFWCSINWCIAIWAFINVFQSHNSAALNYFLWLSCNYSCSLNYLPSPLVDCVHLDQMISSPVLPICFLESRTSNTETQIDLVFVFMTISYLPSLTGILVFFHVFVT